MGGPYEENPDGTFHRGYNKINEVVGNMLIYTMDNDANGGLELEAMCWDGDSGGPALIEVDGKKKIAGVNSTGEGPGYGKKDEFTRLGSPHANTWILDNIKDHTVGEGVTIDDC